MWLTPCPRWQTSSTRTRRVSARRRASTTDRTSGRGGSGSVMRLPDVLIELYDRVPPLVRNAADGLDADDLQWRPSSEANSIGWLLWHLIRVQDHHVSELLEEPQLWTM